MQDILINTECWLVSKENVDNFTRLFKKESLAWDKTATAGFLMNSEMTCDQRLQKFHTDWHHYPDLDSASDWLKQISLVV